jgi:catechol 2,3-dioxygenase-like lactoylglutathione lyase family enzyme
MFRLARTEERRPPMMRNSRPTVHCNEVHPSVFVADVERSGAFYVEKLGFQHEFRWGDPVCMVAVRLGTIVIYLEEGDPHPATTWIHFVVGDADELFEFQRSQGVEIREPPTDRTYGRRTFLARDLCGNTLAFSHPLPR